ncbi:MAG: DUF3253 domain-containing protein [Salinisphaeraceae bacterium]
MAGDAQRNRIVAEIRRLTMARGPDKSCCPSDIARRLDPDAWRRWMPAVRDAALMLARDGEIDVCQRGVPVDPGLAPRGPIRLRRRGC